MNIIENFFWVDSVADMDMGISVYFDCTLDNTIISLKAVPAGQPLAFAGAGYAQILPAFDDGGWEIDRGLHQFSWYPYDNAGTLISSATLYAIHLQWMEDGLSLIHI